MIEKVGDGSWIKLGLDPWVGSGEAYKLTWQRVQTLREHGFFHLGKITNHAISILGRQGWIQAYFLGFEGEDEQIWERYLASLRSSHVRIHDTNDELIWTKNVVDKCYTSKLGYLVLREGGQGQESPYWSKKLWKLKCQLKANIFMWLLLHNRVQTWDFFKGEANKVLSIVLYASPMKNLQTMYLSYVLTLS